MSPDAGGTERPLGLPSLLALGVNGTVGVGIVFAPSAVAESIPGYLGVAVYPLTVLCLVPIALVYARLGARYRENGGPYVWAREAFGGTAGFFVGWIAYVAALFSAGAVLAGLGHHVAPAVQQLCNVSESAVAVLCALSFALVASLGLSPSAIVWNAMTVIKLVPLLLLVGLFLTNGVTPAQTVVPDAGGLSRAVLVVVFATQGFEVVPVLAGSVRNARRSVPMATLGTLACVAVLYSLLHAACVSALPSLARSGSPIAEAARTLGGDGVGTLATIGTTISAMGIAFGMFALTPRYLAALGRKDVLGELIGREDKRDVPQLALWLSAFGIVLLVSVGSLEGLFVLSSVAVLAQYLAAILAYWCLSRRGDAALPPRGLWVVPIAIAVTALMAQGAKWEELYVAGGVLAVGGLVLMGRRRLLAPAS